MKQSIIQISLVGFLCYHTLPARGLAKLLTKSESFSFISFPCNFFSASFVSNTRICHNKLCQIETLLTPGLTYQFGISVSPSVVDQSSFKPFPIVFVLFLALEIFSLGAIILFFYWLATDLPKWRPWTICPKCCKYLPCVCVCLFVSLLLLGFVHVNFCISFLQSQICDYSFCSFFHWLTLRKTSFQG